MSTHVDEALVANALVTRIGVGVAVAVGVGTPLPTLHAAHARQLTSVEIRCTGHPVCVVLGPVGSGNHSIYRNIRPHFLDTFQAIT